jgi:DNA-binding response OmpR family regulator
VAKGNLLLISTVGSTLKLVKQALQKHFEFVVAESGAEALELLRKNIPLAIIMDHSIEDFHTNQFIDKVRNSSVTRNLPFIIVSRESSNTFVEQGVRSGVSHYVGIPFDAEVLLQKVQSTLDPKGSQDWDHYFRMPGESETQAISFGRISFVTNEGIHFETHLKLSPGQKIHLSSPLTSAVSPSPLEIEVKEVGTDVYYNYPFAVDAIWCDENAKSKITSWINAHRHLNSPKKQKVLIVLNDIAASEKFQKDFDMSQYSIRIVANIQEALQNFPYMRPSSFIVKAEDWQKAGAQGAKILELITQYKTKWILAGELAGTAPIEGPKPFVAPARLESLAMAVREVTPPLPADPDRLYFSKTLEDSRCKFFFGCKTLILGEMGVRLAFPFELSPPCNMQLALKIFSEQNLRNPYIRVWPPLKKISGAESSAGKYPYSAETHFLGINDQQSQAIRQWLQNEELKEKRKTIAAVAPKSKTIGLAEAEAAETKKKLEEEQKKTKADAKSPPKKA